VSVAWIAFRLNGEPIRTKLDGDFNCIALMDAASGFILGMELCPESEPEESQALFRQLLRNAEQAARSLPNKLYLVKSDEFELLASAVTDTEMEVFMVPEGELEVFIGEAKRSFAGRFEETKQ
jgi:hypothetical protein